MHGLGNDFVVLDATQSPFRPTPEQARWLADRRLGVGCDQILVVEPPSAAHLDFDYRIFNADGSESGQCGNGARCLAKFIRRRGLSGKSTLRVRTCSGELMLEHRPDGMVRVDMGVPRLDPKMVPFTAAARSPRYTLTLDGGSLLEIGAASIGNPHVVIPVQDVAVAPVAELGAAVQRHPAFPESANVGFLQVLDSARAKLRVFERGVGETPACGSGACAAAVVGQVWGLLGTNVSIEVPGGALQIEWAGDGQPVFMTGPAETVYEGTFEWPGQKLS